MRLPSIACLIVLPFLVGCREASTSSTPAPASKVGKSVETATQGDLARTSPEAAEVDLQLLDWEGLQQLLASHHGKVVVLDCWSTSCAPCIAEFPNLVALQNKHNRDDLACVSLSFDYEGIGRPEDQQERVLAFLQKQRAAFDNVLSTLDSDALSAKLEIPSIPAAFVYDREGKLHQSFDNRHASRTGGPFTYEQVSAVVEQLLAEPAENAE
jgi:thiol-disulfide isomerase/thioredoxin